MDPEVARRLVSEEGTQALAAAAAQADPGSLSAATALRKRFDPALAAAALAQEALRRRAATKFGDSARRLFLTPDGLEQATRPDVARWRAERMVAAGVRRVLDLGCGIGTDALAMAAVGLDVVAVDRDETAAVLAAANLARHGERREGIGPATVRHADATAVDLEDRTVFCDPARRTGAGRTWQIGDFSPPWEFVTGLLARAEGACLKLGPGLPHRLIPPNTLTEWVSHNGDLVEACIWSSALADGRVGRAARLLPNRGELRVDPEAPDPPVGDPQRYLHEPEPGVLASGALPTLAAMTGAARVHPEIAYLTTDTPVDSPFWTTFEIRDSFPWREKDLRRWVGEHAIGTLEIKKRGIDVDPAALRRRLRPKGPGRATIVITPTLGRAQVLVVERVDAPARDGSG
ncbi:class I SAM-dependent methyltransferase [Granulicoccus sp. GXG6511]|uniref:class I SAM-dependent methyltransferase n=1 Tax=Granulicoccus sp. GXG6511 TaxID=3381351 RepID=UPI003D7E626E